MYAMCASEMSSCRLLREGGVLVVAAVSDAGEDKARRRKMRVTEVNIVRIVVYSRMDGWSVGG
jgi:hypothetical protein